jgi:hypothetical protein
MRTRIVKISAIVAVAGLAILGSAYANAKPLQGTSKANASATGTTSAASGATVALKAVPDVGPVKNIAHSYSTATTGGTGEVLYSIPSLPDGIYEVSFTANFFPAGTPAAPVQFSCGILNGSGVNLYAQDTSLSASTSGFYVGVNGAAFLRNPSSLGVQAFCGTIDGSTWSFGSRPLVVTLTRMDGLTHGSLSPSPNKKAPGIATH